MFFENIFAKYVGTAKNGFSITAPSGKVYNFNVNDFLPIDKSDLVFLSTYRTPIVKTGCDSCDSGGAKVIYTDEEWAVFHRQDLMAMRKYWTNFYNLNNG